MAEEHEWWNSPCSARTGDDDEAACSTAPADGGDESAVGSTPMSFGHGGQPSLSDAAAASSFLLAGQHMGYWTQDFMGGRAAAAATASFDTLLQLQLQGGDAASRRLLLGDHAAAPPRHLVVPGAPYGGGGGDATTGAPPQGVSPTPYEAADNLQQQQSFPGGHHVVSNTERLHDHHQDAGSPSPATRSSPGSPAAAKKPRIEAPSPMPTFKVRKEKLGDRITALQQLVSPFGKSLSSPYLRCGRPMQLQHQQGSHKVNGNCEGKQLDLRSRGLCLVPVASTYTVASETATEFWHPTFGGTFR
uniref:BHLH domain-containing protein n=1 Tax=Oryza meridionalis TaxID=40149 RepID=A0A0E0FDR2_9ORYZ